MLRGRATSLVPRRSRRLMSSTTLVPVELTRAPRSAPPSDHWDPAAGRFFNTTTPLGPNQGQGLAAVFKMMMEPRTPWPNARLANEGVPKLDADLGPKQVALTFVGHATFLVQLPGGINVLTDPMFSERASPFQWAGPRRFRDPGVALDALPKIDVVLLSHNHYDHLDVNTLTKLAAKFNPTVVVPLGDRALVESTGMKDVHEMDWWERVELRPGVFITFTPQQHFAARGLFDRFKSLWGSYVIEFGDERKKVYFGADGGYSTHFSDIGKRVGAPDVAMLGIGAYEPNWFMKVVHTNPAEAVQAHLDLGAKRSVPMHYGTFQLSAESIDQPLKELDAALAAKGVAKDDFARLAEGATRVFDL